MSVIYHTGEQKVQQLVGESAAAESNGRSISDTLARGALNFIERQSMLIASSVSTSGKVWTSLLIGDLGFVHGINGNEIQITLDMVHSTTQDILFENLKFSSTIGLLFIELSTRRRYRINGTCVLTKSAIKVEIRETYGNCPQYIQRRDLRIVESIKKAYGIQQSGSQWNDEIIKLIQNADTLFVGSTSQEGNMDASHRGGKPGFVTIMSDGKLKIPDYNGNSMFNTLGNFVQNPSAGILFIDFVKRETLQVSGVVELLFGQGSVEDLMKTGGTGRYWVFTPQSWIYTQNHHADTWKFIDHYPYNP